MPSTDLICDPFAAVTGTLLHADAWDALTIPELAARSALTLAQTVAAVDQLHAEDAALKLTIDGQHRYRLTSSGVRFAVELCGEQPRAWRA